MDREIFELDRQFRKEIYEMAVNMYAKFLSELAKEMKEFQKETLFELLSGKEEPAEEKSQKPNAEMIKQFTGE